jgi:galactokinase
MKRPNQEALNLLYGETTESGLRYEALSRHFEELFHREPEGFFTAPGRTEIIGNHTDHNGGKILAASIDMDTIGAAAPTASGRITFVSEGHEPQVEILLSELDQVPRNQGTLSLVAGILEGAGKMGYAVGGFEAYLSSNVIAAAGVSSSASFEMLICSILNHFYNQDKMTYVDYAKIGQYAENHFWSKASGLMDQMACAVGGVISLDFSGEVKYEKVDFSFSDMGYELIIVNTGKGHADLSNAYSEIPEEMKQVAKLLDRKQLSECSEEDFLNALPQMEETLSNDRALLRAFHFFEENKRVEKAIDAIREKNVDQLLQLLEESGNSSWKWLQNCYPIHNATEQKVPLILALTEYFIGLCNRSGCIGDNADSGNHAGQAKKSDVCCSNAGRIEVSDICCGSSGHSCGCCRVHGGGFAGVIMCVLPKERVEAYIDFISHYVEPTDIYPVRIRKVGAVPIAIQ